MAFAHMGSGGYNMTSSAGSVTTVLLVDDEALVRIGTAMMIEELDYAVLQASSGAQALELLGENKSIDILVTDFRMPDIDGIEMITRARTLMPAIKVVLMTGYDIDDERFAAIDSPRLAKPFTIDELEEALAQCR